MELTKKLYRNIEVTLANKITGLLISILTQKHNLQINFFHIENPLLVFTIVNSRAFHFCKVRSLHSNPIRHEELTGVLDHWISQGAEVELSENVKKFSVCDEWAASIINFTDSSDCKIAVTYLPPDARFLVFKKKDEGSMDQSIWSFMNTIWKLADVIDYTEISNENEVYYLLTCKKRP